MKTIVNKEMEDLRNKQSWSREDERQSKKNVFLEVIRYTRRFHQHIDTNIISRNDKIDVITCVSVRDRPHLIHKAKIQTQHVDIDN